MKGVLRDLLGQGPWSLSTADGSLRKRSRTRLSKNLEKISVSAEMLPEYFVTIVDLKSIVLQIRGSRKGFSDIVKIAFDTIMTEALPNRKADVIYFINGLIKKIQRV